MLVTTQHQIKSKYERCDLLNHIELFTDGGADRILRSQHDKTFYGSSAFVVRFNNTFITSCDPVSEGTNNYYELKAIRDGLRYILNNWKLDDIEVRIVSDSKYSIQCVTEWVHDWIKRGHMYYKRDGKPVANSELIMEIVAMLNNIPHYKFLKIKSHISTDMLKTFEIFKADNYFDLSFEEYLQYVKYNDLCDSKISHALNLKRRALSYELGVDVL